MTAVNIHCSHYLRHCPPTNNRYVHKRPHRILQLRLAAVVAVIVLLFGLSFPLVTVIGMIPSAFFYSSRHQQRIALQANVAFVGWNHRRQQQPTIRHLRRYLHVSSSSNRIRNSVSSSALSSQMTPFPGISNNNNNTNTLDNGRYGNNNTNGIGMSSSELAERRLRYYQATKEEKIQSLHNIQKRNLHIKKQLSNHDNNTAAMQLIAVKVNVCPELRHELKLSGREKRGRLFVEPDSNPTKSLRALKRELHGFFRSLKKDTFQLYASLQIVPDGGGNDVQQQQIDNGTNTNDNNFPQDSIVKGEEVRWPIETDDDVVATFQRALQFFDEQIQRQRPPTTNESSDRNLDINENVLKRPSIMLYVQRDPNAPIVTPPPQPYLENMPNPEESTTITMLSFYSFGNIQNPEEFAMQLRKLWKPFQVQGRVYVATEGMNAQMSVPTNVLSQFIECCDYYLPDPGVSYYLRTYGNSVNIDPIPLTRVEYESAGTPSAGGKPAPPFTNLHIRVRQQIVTDGLEKPYNWMDSGYDMPPLEWHQKLESAKKLREEGKVDYDNSDHNLPIILDCRNTYETDVGIFEGAVPLKTTTFKDTWDAIEEQLADKPKDSPIMMYCTGGIRCVKVGAYVTQELGFTNVSRLAGGIIAYDRALLDVQQQEQSSDTSSDDAAATADQDKSQTTNMIKDQIQVNPRSLFKGTNFVFDGRLGRKITDDALGTCVTCGSNTTLVSNCRNDNCHKRMIQCENCRTDYLGTCSDACRNRVRLLQQRLSKQQMNGGVNKFGLLETSSSPLVSNDDNGDDSSQDATEKQPKVNVFNTIDEYSTGHSSPLPEVYAEVEYNTKALIPTGSHMVSGQSQGRLLKQLASMTREGRILELGTFTGYATACLLEGAIEAGNAIGSTGGSRSGGPFVMSMERDAKAYEVAAAHMNVIAKYGFKGIHVMEALCALRHATDRTTKKGNGIKSPVTIVDNNNLSVSFTTNDKVATCELVKVSDALATIEEIATGLRYGDMGNDDYLAPFDMIFVDADKTRLIEYVEACLTSDRLLKRGGLIVVDNVLWKGLVLEASGSPAPTSVQGLYSNDYDDDSTDDDDNSSGSDDEASSDRRTKLEIRKNRRARKLANKMHRFNSAVVLDDRVEVLVLPLRDGLSIIRKK